MAKLIFALSQSLDGYVDHMELGRPDQELFRHFIEHERGLSGAVYGRRTYDILRYWDEDQAGWDSNDAEFAAAWRGHPKWVVSNSLRTVGPNATLVRNDLGTVLAELKSRLNGDIAVAGPALAQSLAVLGLVDEYRLYLRPRVLGRGTPFFAGPRPSLRLLSAERMGGDVLRLAYAPA